MAFGRTWTAERRRRYKDTIKNRRQQSNGIRRSTSRGITPDPPSSNGHEIDWPNFARAATHHAYAAGYSRGLSQGLGISEIELGRRFTEVFNTALSGEAERARNLGLPHNLPALPAAPGERSTAGESLEMDGEPHSGVARKNGGGGKHRRKMSRKGRLPNGFWESKVKHLVKKHPGIERVAATRALMIKNDVTRSAADAALDRAIKSGLVKKDSGQHLHFNEKAEAKAAAA